MFERIFGGTRSFPDSDSSQTKYSFSKFFNCRISFFFGWAGPGSVPRSRCRRRRRCRRRTNNRARATETETTRFHPSWARPKIFSDPLLFETFASNLYCLVVMMTMPLMLLRTKLKFEFEKRSPASLSKPISKPKSKHEAKNFFCCNLLNDFSLFFRIKF